jgi:hypothetical protein
MAILRDGLVALVPIAERARIAWRGDDVYDEWDRITEALFQSLVVDSIGNSNAGPLSRPLAKYGFVEEPLAELSVIQVAQPSILASELAFIDFTSTAAPFDTVRAKQLSDGSSDLIQLPYGGAAFRLRPWVYSGDRPTHADLRVQL